MIPANALAYFLSERLAMLWADLAAMKFIISLQMRRCFRVWQCR